MAATATSVSPTFSSTLLSSTRRTATQVSCYTGSSSRPPLSTRRPYDGYWAEVVEWRNSNKTCDNHETCLWEIDVNPDIAGIGILSAFMATAWTTFALSAATYCFGLLSPTLATKVDHLYFGANSRNHGSPWKKAVEDIVLIFSDQQLILGLAMLVAGYYTANEDNLDCYHWQLVTYMAWLSGNVHLMSISLVTDQLRESHTMRRLRTTGMIVLFGLLLAALYAAIKCAGSGRLSSLPRCYLRYPSGLGVYGEKENAVVAYTTLVGVYVWKFGQLFEHRLPPVRSYLRRLVEAYLRALAQPLADKPSYARFVCLWVVYKASMFLYLTIMVWIEALDSYMATLLALLFSLSWGTMKLRKGRSAAATANSWSFGQILPLLLLLQPVMAAAQASQNLLPGPKTIIRKIGRARRRSRSNQASVDTANLLVGQDQGRVPDNTLSKILEQNCSLPVQLQAATSGSDLVTSHLHTSRIFRLLVYVAYVNLVGVFTAVLYFQSSPVWATDSASTILYIIPMAMTAVPSLLLLAWPFSRRLR